MESRNLTQLHQFPIKDGTNRYLIQRVVYPQNSYVTSLVQEETLSQNKDNSTDDDTCVEGEYFIYVAGMQIFTIEIRQPDFVHHQMCLDLSKFQCSIECFTAFPLPQQFQTSSHYLPLNTGILVVRNKNNVQDIKFYNDSQKELDISFESKKRIIWMNSRYLQEKVILIVGFNDQSVGIYNLEFKDTTTVKMIQEYQFQQLMLFQEIFTHNQVHYISIVSYNGIIALFLIDLQYEIISHVHQISRITSPPKMYLYEEKVQLIVPIQNGQMLQYQDIQINGLKKWNILKYQNQNKSMITAFDIEPKKNDKAFESTDEFEICIIHFDGTLSLYDFIENNISIEYSKQLNNLRFFVSNMQLQFKQFILMGSDEDVEIFQLSLYHIN